MADWVYLGDRAVRFPRPPGVSARALVRAAREWPGVIDVVVAREDAAVYFAVGSRTPNVAASVDASSAASDALAARIAALAALPPDDSPVRDHELRATYAGEDLDEVARASGLTIAEVIDRHAAATYTVDMIGFRPGFAYLVGLDPALELPRRATPRPRVPAGSLAIADRFTAIYPGESPGGWHLIGHVAEAMFGPAGARLHLGDRVRFVR